MALDQPTGQPGPLQPGEFASASRASEVTFKLRDMSPSQALYVRPEEQLVLHVWNSAPGASPVSFGTRLLLTNGQLQVGDLDVPVTSNRLHNVFVLPLPEGYLMNVVARASFGSFDGGGLNRGQCFIQVLLGRGAGVFAGPAVGCLTSGYSTKTAPIWWPGGRQDSSVEGPGWVHSVQQANPAAGADWIYTVPTNARQRVQSIASILTTSAAPANRNVSLIVDDGANTLWQHDLAASIAASTAQIVDATTTNAPTGVITTTTSLVLPPGLILEPTHRIRTSTANLQAGDQWSAIWLLLEEWISP